MLYLMRNSKNDNKAVFITYIRFKHFIASQLRNGLFNKLYCFKQKKSDNPKTVSCYVLIYYLNVKCLGPAAVKLLEKHNYSRDILLWLVELLLQVARWRLAGDFDHGQLLVVAGHVARRPAHAAAALHSRQFSFGQKW